MARVAAALFDNDGLTLDTESAWTRAETVLFARYGARFTPEHKRELVGTSPSESEVKMERMLGVPGRRLMVELHELAMAELAAGVPPRPGAVELLAALRAEDVGLALVSNSPRAWIDLGLRKAGLTGAFDAIVSVDDVERPKPAPDPYLTAARHLGADPATCAVLEDSPTGVAAGRAAGALTIGVPSLPAIVLDADVVAESLADAAVWRALGLDASVP